MPIVNFYETNNARYSFLMDKIEENREWAIVHDLSDNEWAIWVNGRCVGIKQTLREAERLMDYCHEEYDRDPSRW